MNSSSASEYQIPTNDVPAEVFQGLSPWIAGFIGLSKEAANERLAARWENLSHSSLEQLRDTLLEFEVSSIIVTEHGGSIKAVRADPSDYFFLPAPLGVSHVESSLESFGLSKNEVLVQFLVNFGGMAERLNESGRFIYSPPWRPFDQESGWPNTIENYEEWRGSLPLFFSLNGGTVLVKNSGEIGWCILQENRVRGEADSVSDFVAGLSEYRKVNWPLDPYGLPDDLKQKIR